MIEPLVSIVILNYNGLRDLKECFDSLYNLNYKNFELIFVDNKSQDNSVDFIRKNYPVVKIIELKKNYGFAKGNNFGAGKANGKYIILLNNDTLVDKNWLIELVKVAEQKSNIGIVGSKNYYYDDRSEIFYAIGTCDRFGNTQNIGRNKRDNLLFNTQIKCFFVCGAALMIKRELYEKINLFDPTYFIYYEDVDLCWRTILSGYDVVYVPKSFIYHKVGRVIKNTDRKRFLLERNKLRTILKNYELKSLVKILPKYFMQRLLIIFKYSFNKKRLSYILLLTYFKAIIWNLIHIRSLIKNRTMIQAIRKKDDKFLFNFMENLQKYVDRHKNPKP